MYLYGVRLCTMNNSSRGLLLCRATPPHTKHTEVGRCVECWIRFSKVSRWVRAGRSGYCAESCWIAVLLCNSLPLSLPILFFRSHPPFRKTLSLFSHRDRHRRSSKFDRSKSLVFSFSLFFLPLSLSISSTLPFLFLFFSSLFFFEYICCTIRVSQYIPNKLLPYSRKIEYLVLLWAC